MRGTERVVWTSVSMTVWYRLSFLFLESSIKVNTYLYLLELFAFPLISYFASETEDAVVFQRDEAPFCFNRKMRCTLNALFRNGWK